MSKFYQYDDHAISAFDNGEIVGTHDYIIPSFGLIDEHRDSAENGEFLSMSIDSKDLVNPICSRKEVVLTHEWLKVVQQCDKYNPEKGSYITSRNPFKTEVPGPIIKNNGIQGMITAMSVIPVSDDNGDIKYSNVMNHIMNTENGGLRHVVVTEDQVIVDIGPVVNTCFIGNYERPEGIYVPLSNIECIKDGKTILDNILNKNDYEQLPDKQKVIETGNENSYSCCEHHCKCNHKY